MIRVMIHQDNDIITGYDVEGHAEFAESGKDIVCSAVSAITVGTVNSVEGLLGVTLETEMKKGLLIVTVPKHAAQEDEVQLLLKSMVVMLETIEASYGDFIRLKTDKGRR